MLLPCCETGQWVKWLSDMLTSEKYICCHYWQTAATSWSNITFNVVSPSRLTVLSAPPPFIPSIFTVSVSLIRSIQMKPLSHLFQMCKLFSRLLLPSLWVSSLFGDERWRPCCLMIDEATHMKKHNTVRSKSLWFTSDESLLWAAFTPVSVIIESLVQKRSVTLWKEKSLFTTLFMNLLLLNHHNLLFRFACACMWILPFSVLSLKGSYWHIWKSHSACSSAVKNKSWRMIIINEKWKEEINIQHTVGLTAPPHDSLGTMKPEGLEGRRMRGRILTHHPSCDFQLLASTCHWSCLIHFGAKGIFSYSRSNNISYIPVADICGWDLMTSCRQD